ncbi:hypothetical protein O3M35_011626 [Rhynocoris fuscipes]
MMIYSAYILQCPVCLCLVMVFIVRIYYVSNNEDIKPFLTSATLILIGNVAYNCNEQLQQQEQQLLQQQQLSQQQQQTNDQNIN